MLKTIMTVGVIASTQAVDLTSSQCCGVSMGCCNDNNQHCADHDKADEPEFRDDVAPIEDPVEPKTEKEEKDLISDVESAA